MKLFSPAKINLFFRILSKRDDGYHEIETLMQTISMGDTLTLEKSDQDEYDLNDDNLVIKALKLFRRHTGQAFSVAIDLKKVIPIQAGLGGGSSNAATTLWGLNELGDCPLSNLDLIEMSRELGSDVPFFFSNGTAYCWGRGELFEEADPDDNPKLWIVKPKGIGLSTPLVYSASVPNPNGDHFGNDLEKSAFTLLPSLQALKEKLYHTGFDFVQMTGSGTAFYCRGNPESVNLPDVEMTKATYVQRTDKEWYHADV